MAKVLIVDDSGVARLFARRRLESAGILSERILEFENGKDAIAFATDPEVGLIIVDLVMPEVSGKDFLRLCRRARVSACLMVVSGTVDVILENELKQLGAAAVVEKPLSLAAVAQMLDQLADRFAK